MLLWPLETLKAQSTRQISQWQLSLQQQQLAAAAAAAAAYLQNHTSPNVTPTSFEPAVPVATVKERELKRKPLAGGVHRLAPGPVCAHSAHRGWRRHRSWHSRLRW